MVFFARSGPWLFVKGANVILLAAVLVAQSSAAFAEGALSCIVEPSMTVNVGAAVSGVMDTVEVDRSDIVKKGQLIATIESGVERATVDYYAARVEFAERKLARAETLREENLMSEQEYDEMVTEQTLAKLECREKQRILGQRSIYSPIDGVVVERMLSPGDYIENQQIFKILALDPLYIETVLPVEMFGKVKIGETYEVFLETFTDPFMVKVSNVDRVVDKASSTFKVRLILKNPGYRIPSGLKCRVEFAPNKSPK